MALTKNQAAMDFRYAIVTAHRNPTALNLKLTDLAREVARQVGVDVERVEQSIRDSLARR